MNVDLRRLPDASWMTHADYRVARVLAALEDVYSDWKPAPGRHRPSELVAAYEHEQLARWRR